MHHQNDLTHACLRMAATYIFVWIILKGMSKLSMSEVIQDA